MTVAEAQILLMAYGNFEEAILLRICTTNLHRDMEAYVSPTWVNGQLRPDLDTLRPIRATFRGISRLEFRNELLEEQMGVETLWGLSEIARIKVVECHPGLAFKIQWESDREILVECLGFEIDEVPDWARNNGISFPALDSSFYPQG